MIDAWTDPSNPPTPGQFPYHATPGVTGIGLLLDKIKGIETNLREVTSNLLRTAGIYLSPAGMTIDSNLTLTGTLTATEVIQTAALVPGAVTVSKLGAGAVTAPAIADGSVGYAALANPVAPGVVYGTASNFALGTTWATLLTSTITVPPGFTQCAFSMSSRVFAHNPNTTGGVDGAGGDYLYSRTTIAGIFPPALPILAKGWPAVTIIDPFSVVGYNLTPGGTTTIIVEAMTGLLAWAADADNIVDLSGSLLWFR